MEEMERWYENLTYSEVKDILQEKLENMKKDFIASGYYLKYIRDHRQYLEDGFSTIWEFAESNYGIKASTASRWMAMNDKFSQDGNSPILAEEYKEFGKSQLQEMLYLEDNQIEEVTPDMTVKEIRKVRNPDPVPSDDTAKTRSSHTVEEDRSNLEKKESVAMSQKDLVQIKHFTADIIDAYGAMWSKAVHEYLMTGYKKPDKECDVTALGFTYKVLKRTGVTVFYDSSGQTLFDVENERLEREYQFFVKNSADGHVSKPNEKDIYSNGSMPARAECVSEELYEEPTELCNVELARPETVKAIKLPDDIFEINGPCCGGIEAIEFFEQLADHITQERISTEFYEEYECALNRFRYEIKKSIPVPTKKIKRIHGKGYIESCGNCGSGYVAEPTFVYCPICGGTLER